MKTWLFNLALTLFLGTLTSSCTNTNQHEQTATNTSSISDTTATPMAEETTAKTDKTVSQSAAESTQADSSKQNYTFAPDRDKLQIIGSETQYDILLPTDVLFDFDRATLRPDGLQLLEKVKAHFATHGVDQLHVWGHTDAKGDDQYNFKLSQRRAMAVANWLKKNIKTKGLIMSIGRGEQEPLVPNENPDGSDNTVNRQKNRRVTLSVVKYPSVNKLLKKPSKAAQ